MKSVVDVIPLVKNSRAHSAFLSSGVLSRKPVIDSALLELKTITDKTVKISSEIIQGPPRPVIVDEVPISSLWVHVDWVHGIDYCWAH